MKKRTTTPTTPARADRWQVPYTAPGSKGGTLTVAATSRAAAVEKVTDILMRSHSGVLVDRSRPGQSKFLTLTTRERTQIQFGEPVNLGPVKP